MLLDPRRARIATLAAVALGIVLRVWQYVGRDSFFMDEIALLRCIAERSWSDLVGRPLDYDQLAPPAFLLTEKASIVLGGPGELPARLFPLACSVGAVVVFTAAAGRLVSRSAALTAVVLFATAGPLVVFAAQLKQYSIDVLATCLLLWLGSPLAALPERRRPWPFGIVGVIVVWFSQPSAFVLGGMGAVLFGEHLRAVFRQGERPDRNLVAALALVGISTLCAVVVAKHRLDPGSHAFLYRFWAEGFPPHDLDGWLSRPWPAAQALELFGRGGSNAFGYPLPALFATGAAVGLVLLALRDATGRLVAAPVLVVLLACAARQYPFSARLAFFVAPCFFLAIAVAAQRAAEWMGGGRAVGWIPMLIAAAASFPVLTTLPTYHRDHVRPLLERLASVREPSGKVYVYFAASPAFWVYGPGLGIADEGVVSGECHRGDAPAYLPELDALRGSKTAFVLLSHTQVDERADIQGYLDAIGRRISEVDSPSRWYFGNRDDGTKLLEYDLADPARLRAVRADGYPVQPYDRDPLVPCGHGPLAMPHAKVPE